MSTKDVTALLLFKNIIFYCIYKYIHQPNAQMQPYQMRGQVGLRIVLGPQNISRLFLL